MICFLERKEVLGEKEFEFIGFINGENIEFNGDELDDGIYWDFFLLILFFFGNIML